MKKICFLILMLVGVSAKSNALQFSDLCDFFNNNAPHIANMTINFDNGASATVTASSMREICQEQHSDNSWDAPITTFSLGVVALGLGAIPIIVPCVQYAYKRWCGGQSAEEKKLNSVNEKVDDVERKLVDQEDKLRRIHAALDGGEDLDVGDNSVLGRIIQVQTKLDNLLLAKEKEKEESKESILIDEETKNE